MIIRTERELNEAYQILKEAENIGADTETSGLDPHTDKLWSIQFSDGKHSFLVPCNEGVRLGPLKELLVSEKHRLIWHNAAFDLKMLWANGYKDVKNVYCTKVGEQILTAGLFAPADLASTLKRRLGIELSKEERKEFYDKNHPNYFGKTQTWTPELIRYALADVDYLPKLFLTQLSLARSRGLLDVLGLEMDVAPITAALEFRGVLLDRDGCFRFQKEMAGRAEVERELLKRDLEVMWQQYWRPLYKSEIEKYERWEKKWEKIKAETNRMRDPNNRRTVSQEAKAIREEWEKKKPFAQRPKERGPININSRAQMLPALREAGVFLRDLRKETLQDAHGESPLLDMLLEYRKYQKLGQFGELFEKINPATGRIHTQYNQNVDTGRYSSSSPNLQNIPARTDEGKRFRSLFMAPLGKRLVVADFSAIELVIIGVLSRDQTILEALNLEDPHCFTMSKFLGCDYASLVKAKEGEIDQKVILELPSAIGKFEAEFNLPDLLKIGREDYKKWVKTLRDYVKTLTYGIAYGLSNFGLARRFHCDPETAQHFIDTFFSVYSKIKEWLELQADLAWMRGYSESASGRKRFYRKPAPPTYDDVKKAVEAYLAESQRLPDSIEAEERRRLYAREKTKLWREFEQRRNRIRRQAANQPIQGTSADITKLSMVMAESALSDNGFAFSDGIVLTVHDELCLEVSEERAEEAAKLLEKAMVDAAHAFLGNDVLIKVEPHIVSYWSK